MAGFLVRSVRHPSPLLDLELFKIRSFAVGNLVQVIAAAPMFGWVVLMPSFLRDVWGWSPLHSGLAIVPNAAVAAALSPLAGRLADRVGHRALITTGCIVGAAGALWWVAFVHDEPNYLAGLLPGLILTGVGATACVATATGATYESRPAALLLDERRSTHHDLPTRTGRRDRRRRVDRQRRRSSLVAAVSSRVDDRRHRIVHRRTADGLVVPVETGDRSSIA